MLSVIERAELRDQLMRHEGRNLKPYADTVGKLTIGYGRNLTDVGISEAEAQLLLDHDIETAESELGSVFPWTTALDPIRLRVLIDMAFNMGIAGLRTFKRFLAAVETGDYQTAAADMLESRWARQVGKRAQTLAWMMRDGPTVPDGTLKA
jgi:lysozyme